MATLSTTEAIINPGYRSETSVTVADSSAGTFSAEFRDLHGCDYGTVTVEVVDATTVKMVMDGSATSLVWQPANLLGRDEKCRAGRWYLTLDDGDSNGDTMVAIGNIIYQRRPTDEF